MAYWIKSIPPLLVKKSMLSDLTHVFDWIEKVINLTKEFYKLNDKKFTYDKDFDLLSQGFVLIKLDPSKHPVVKKMFFEDEASHQYKISLEEKYPLLNNEFKRSIKILPKKRGRRKKIIYKDITKK